MAEFNKMTGLPKAYIKKYGVTKSAWQHFRNHDLRNTRTVKTKNKVVYMAKRRTHKKGYSYKNGTTRIITLLGAALVYGAVRPMISGWVSGFAGNLLGGIGVPVLLGTAGYFMSKSSGFIGDFGLAMMLIEAAGLGANLLGGTVNSLVGTSNSSTTALAYS